MKSLLLKKIAVLFVMLSTTFFVYSQTCSDPIRNSWKNIPKIQYDWHSNQYINLGTGSMQTYFNQENFTLDFMVKAENSSVYLDRAIFSADNPNNHVAPYFYMSLKCINLHHRCRW